MAFTLCLTVSADGEKKYADDTVAVIESTTEGEKDTEYKSLGAAVEAITKSQSKIGEITLLTSVTEQVRLNTKDANITINLNGNNISTKEVKKSPIFVENGSITLTGTGKVYEDSSTQYFGGIEIRPSYSNLNDGKIVVNIGPNVTVAGWSGIFINYQTINSSKNLYNGNVTVNLEGTAISQEEKLDDKGYGIYVNGEIVNTSEYAIINIKNGAKVKNENHATNGDGQAIYLAGYAQTNIEDGAEISGYYSAIEIRAGELNINGGTFNATCSDDSSSSERPNGGTTKSAAIAVAQHSTRLPIEVNISGGKFSGTTALYESNPEKNGSQSISKVSLDITGGTFTSTKESAVYSQDVKSFIKGGTFSSDVSAYLATDYNIAKVDNVYKVTKNGDTLPVEKVTPAVEEKVYETLKDQTVKAGQEDVIITGSTEIILNSVDVTDTTEKEKAIETAKTAISSKTETNYLPLNITLTAKTDAGDKTIIDLGEGNEITVTLYLDKDTLGLLKGKDIKVVRIHDGKTDVLKANLNGNALTFSTNKFSTYVIAYSEPEKVTPTKSYSAKDKNQDGVISCEEEMNSANWILSESKKACVYKVSNTGVR